MSAKQFVATFVHTIYSVCFHIINTTVIYEITALLKFTYIILADLLKQFLDCDFYRLKLFYKIASSLK